MGEVLTSSFSAPSRRLNVIPPIPAPVRLALEWVFPHLMVRPRGGFPPFEGLSPFPQQRGSIS